MGHCGSLAKEAPSLSSHDPVCSGACARVDVAKAHAARLGQPSLSRNSARASFSEKGLVVWVDSVEDLVRVLPFEIDADLRHLHALPSLSARDCAATGFGESEAMEFTRDVGVRCEGATNDFMSITSRQGESPRSATETKQRRRASENQDNFACVQVDDMAAPWGLYGVADGFGPQGHFVSALLVHEFASILVQNSNFMRDANLALYQSFVAVSEKATSCQYLDMNNSGGMLSIVLLRDQVLHVAWVGDCKVVLGRLAAQPGSTRDVGAFHGRSPEESVRRLGPKQHHQIAQALDTAHSQMVPPLAAEAGCAAGCPTRPSTDQGQDNGDCRKGLHGSTRPCASSDASSVPSRPPLLRAAELTAESWSMDGFSPKPSSNPACGRQRLGIGGVPRIGGATGNQGGTGGAPHGLSNTCSIRHLRLKPGDVFLIFGTEGVWKWLSPTEAVTIVGQSLHRVAADAANALVEEVAHRRASSNTPCHADLTAIVLYLAGDRYVTEEAEWRLTDDTHALGTHVLRDAQEKFSGCAHACVVPAQPVIAPLLGGVRNACAF